MSTPTTGQRQYAKTPGQRARILDAAMAVFARRGERGASLREIAERVGMSQAGVLHHFGSKNALLLAVLDRFDQEDQPGHPLLTIDESVAFVREELVQGLQRPGLFQLQITLAAESIDPAHPAHDFFVDRYRRVTSQFVEPLDAAAASGGLRDDVDTTALAHLVMGAMEGLQLHHALNPEVDTVASFDLLLDVLAEAFIVSSTPDQV
ncbi:TetR/AcrR family transcriptional regulator [Nocardioides sp. YIM 152315]|uniref:TetR/AcrR family transcriptional regulator n=1 Tax=Nocardioides sp. YIM 152315 TaxID=3031760 RepID=UPI0023DAED30|nr:TetR/AcrR family transcriptional regulator [Nocardioides sp. YIM 152315]MDF1605434.1 TetR/AcrR family transcriptional regulator [Nocardioides sp. YIM 152315]